MTETMMILKKRMEEIGMPQKQLADEINVSYVTMSRWMNGTRQPTIDHVEMMADVLGVTIGISTGEEVAKCPIIDKLMKIMLK